MHDHDHPHTHGNASVSREELLALLKYMLNHNAHGCDNSAAELLHEAVEDIKRSNAKIEEALRLLSEE